jgi:thiosulfate dehydrogenase [quinone] large subunit
VNVPAPRGVTPLQAHGAETSVADGRGDDRIDRPLICRQSTGREDKMNEVEIKSPTTARGRIIEDPPLARFLFSDVRMAWVWLPLRLWLGYEWVTHGWEKVRNPAWMQGGEALKGFWTNAVQIPAEGRPPIAFGWYRGFIEFLVNTESYTWFAKLVAVGELLIGVALIVGAFVGIAAFFGAVLNFNFIMAGSASSNGLLLVAAFALVLAWKIAGYIGADYYLLRWLGVPWQYRWQRAERPPHYEPALEGHQGDD